MGTYQRHQVHRRSAYPRIAGHLLCRAADPELASEIAGLKAHLEEATIKGERLEKTFAKLDQEPSGTRCAAIDGIIKEADATAGEIEDKAVLDAAIVAHAQAVEHYEMCRYGILITWGEEDTQNQRL